MTHYRPWLGPGQYHGSDLRERRKKLGDHQASDARLHQPDAMAYDGECCADLRAQTAIE